MFVYAILGRILSRMEAVSRAKSLSRSTDARTYLAHRLNNSVRIPQGGKKHANEKRTAPCATPGCTDKNMFLSSMCTEHLNMHDAYKWPTKELLLCRYIWSSQILGAANAMWLFLIGYRMHNLNDSHSITSIRHLLMKTNVYLIITIFLQNLTESTFGTI